MLKIDLTKCTTRARYFDGNGRVDLKGWTLATLQSEDNGAIAFKELLLKMAGEALELALEDGPLIYACFDEEGTVPYLRIHFPQLCGEDTIGPTYDINFTNLVNDETCIEREELANHIRRIADAIYQKPELYLVEGHGQ